VFPNDRWCRECQKVKPSEGFRHMAQDGTKKRTVCAECAEKIQKYREAAKRGLSRS
jgi:protein-arginine kinase activator protein McsA